MVDPWCKEVLQEVLWWAELDSQVHRRALSLHLAQVGLGLVGFSPYVDPVSVLQP